MHRVAGEEQGRALAPEALLGQAPHRQQRLARELDQAARAQRGGQPDGAAHRRERRRHRLEDRPADPFEFGGERAPGVAVAGRELVDRRRRLVDVHRQHRAPSVGGRVREHERRAAPPQPVRLEVEGAHDRRRRAERVERAEHVVHVAGMGELGAADGAARLGLRLEHEHTPARRRRAGWRPPSPLGPAPITTASTSLTGRPYPTPVVPPGSGTGHDPAVSAPVRVRARRRRSGRAGHGRPPRRARGPRRATNGGSCSAPTGRARPRSCGSSRSSAGRRPATSPCSATATARSTCASPAGASGSPAARCCNACGRRSPRTTWW